MLGGLSSYLTTKNMMIAGAVIAAYYLFVKKNPPLLTSSSPPVPSPEASGTIVPSTTSRIAEIVGKSASVGFDLLKSTIGVGAISGLEGSFFGR